MRVRFLFFLPGFEEDCFVIVIVSQGSFQTTLHKPVLVVQLHTAGDVTLAEMLECSASLCSLAAGGRMKVSPTATVGSQTDCRGSGGLDHCSTDSSARSSFEQ